MITSEQLKNKYFPVLDNFGFVSLVDYMGGDTDIELSARTSYGKGTRHTSDTRKLLRYLMRKCHTSPTEFVQLKFHISCPIFVARQWIRHRTASVSEISGRYSKMPEYYYIPKYDNFNTQSKDNKQGRSEEKLDFEDYHTLSNNVNMQNYTSFEMYSGLIDNFNISREIARMHLPLSTYTEFYWSIDLHNLFHFLKLRCDSHTQWEFRQYSYIIAKIVKVLCPISFEAWYDYKYKADVWTRLDRILFSKTKALQSEDLESVYNIGKSIGMSKREVEEYLRKINPQSEEDFSLSETDLLNTKSAEYYREIRQGNTDVNTDEISG